MSTKDTLVASARDITPDLAYLVKAGHLPESEALMIALAYQERDAEREETADVVLPACLVAP